MNTAAAKTLVWTCALVVGAGLVIHVAWFLKNRPTILAPGNDSTWVRSL